MNLTHRTTLALMLCLMAITPLSQATEDQVDVKALCKQILCRIPNFKLHLDSEHYFESDVNKPLPVLMNKNLISIYPGETVFIEASIVGDELKLEQAVSSNQHPERTLVFKLSQVEKKKDMMLEVNNPFPEMIKFQMGMMKVDSDRIYATSSCPIGAKLSAFELWPYPIYQLLINQGKVLAKSSTVKCN